MDDKNERGPQEMEYILDGITTRMQLAMEKITDNSKNAMEKMAESNRALRSSNRWLCVTLLAVMIIVVSGFVLTTHLWIGHVSRIRASAVSEVITGETLSQPGPGTGD